MTLKANSSLKKDLILLIPTLGNNSLLTKTISVCNDLGLSILIIYQGNSNIKNLLPLENSNIQIIHIKNKVGVSKARNIGIKYLEKSSKHRFVMTLNESSIPNIDFINQAYMIFQNQYDLDVVCGSYLFHSGHKIESKSGLKNGWDFMKIPEPTMIIRLSTLISIKGYDERLGTGSKSIAQSGEGADLLFRISKKNGKVLNLNLLSATDLRDYPQHSLRTDFGYGFGFSIVGRRNNMTLSCLIRVFSPFIFHLFRSRKGGKPRKFSNICAICFGRGIGLLIPERFIFRKVNL